MLWKGGFGEAEPGFRNLGHLKLLHAEREMLSFGKFFQH